MSSVPSSPEKPRKLLRWSDSSELEDISKERPGTELEDAIQGPGSESSGSGSRREDWYGAKMQRLKKSVESLRKELQAKERDNIRLKNKYNVSKRRQVQLQEDLQKYIEPKLDLDSELEFLRLQLLEKDKEIAKQIENGRHIESNGGHIGKIKNGGNLEDYETDDVEEISFTDYSVLSKKYLNLHKENRKLLTYILLSVSICLSLIAILTRSTFLSTIAVGLWTLSLSCLWLERKQLFSVFKLRYLTKIRDVSMENSRLRVEATKLESRLNELGKELTNEKREREDVISKFRTATGKLCEELSKNEELVKLEKSTFEELQSERVRRRRAEEQLEEVSAQVLLAREKDEVAMCGDVCQELRNNLKLERESKEKLNRENERLIKEIVQMNMSQEKERLKQENDQTFGTELTDEKEDHVSVEVFVQVDGKGCESNLKYTNKKTGNGDGQKLAKDGIIAGIDEQVKNEETFSGQDVTNFDSKECESMQNVRCAIDSQTVETSIQTANADARPSVDPAIYNPAQTITKDCWLCSWNIPNETSLVLLIIIIACLALALKVVLTNNVYMFVVLMTVVGCFTYYQVAWNIEHSN